MIFQSTFRNLLIGRGVQAALGATTGITIYSGVQPTAAEITANWGAYNSASANYLSHYLGATWSRPLDGFLLTIGVPVAVAAKNTGVGAWCIIWSIPTTQVTIDDTILPSASFIVGKVSDGIGDGIIRFSDVNFVATTVKVILDGSIGASM